MFKTLFLFKRFLNVDVGNDTESPITKWGKNGAKTVNDLYQELMTGQCCFLIEGRNFIRTVQEVRLFVSDPNLGTLIEESRVLAGGGIDNSSKLPSTKIKISDEPVPAVFIKMREDFNLNPESYTWNNHEITRCEMESKHYPGIITRYEWHTFYIILLPGTLEKFHGTVKNTGGDGSRLMVEITGGDGVKRTFVWIR